MIGNQQRLLLTLHAKYLVLKSDCARAHLDNAAIGVGIKSCLASLEILVKADSDVLAQAKLDGAVLMAQAISTALEEANKTKPVPNKRNVN
jgi:hypothetical protein